MELSSNNYKVHLTSHALYGKIVFISEQTGMQGNHHCQLQNGHGMEHHTPGDQLYNLEDLEAFVLC